MRSRAWRAEAADGGVQLRILASCSPGWHSLPPGTALLWPWVPRLQPTPSTRRDRSGVRGRSGLRRKHPPLRRYGGTQGFPSCCQARSGRPPARLAPSPPRPRLPTPVRLTYIRTVIRNTQTNTPSRRLSPRSQAAGQISCVRAGPRRCRRRQVRWLLESRSRSCTWAARGAGQREVCAHACT